VNREEFSGMEERKKGQKRRRKRGEQRNIGVKKRGTVLVFFYLI